MQIGQAARVVAQGSPFFGEHGKIVELADAEECVKVQMDHVAKIAGADMPPVALVFRFPLAHLELGPELPAPPVDTEPMGTEPAPGYDMQGAKEEEDADSVPAKAPADAGA